MKIVLPESLSEAEANIRLKKFGPNELPQEKMESFWTRSSRLFKEPMILLLILAATLYLVVGDLIEGFLLGLSVFVVIGIAFYQERKSERALAALRELSSPRALVIRDGNEKRIAAKDLVPGDLISLHEGDRIPADGVILECINFGIDESLLTGESLPAKKTQRITSFLDDGFDEVENQSKIFSSTLVVSGMAIAKVLRTGSQTEVGKIGRILQEPEIEELNLAKEIRQIVKFFAWSGAIICGLLVLILGLTHKDWIQAALIGLATEIALLPEEFPVVLTIFIAMGAWRLSKVKVLVRRPGAIERLGAISILCVDKTGTLTQNRMTVAHLNNGRSSIQVKASTAHTLPDEFHEIVEYGVLASHVDPFDPMEKAIRNLVEQAEWGKDHLHKDWDLVRDYPLSNELLAMSCVWKSVTDSGSYIIATKGAPEAIIDLCHLSGSQKDEILKSVQEIAREGLRVLAVAKAAFLKINLPRNQHDFNLQWVGLIGLEDPLRPEVPEAIQTCLKAGIRVVMMTGDYPETALKIARQAGINTSYPAITGSEVNELTDHELLERLKDAHIFTRVVPQQKLRIVENFKSMGHIVAMTGDGVNDAPSLKRANVGLAMGARGTDVAREAADIILLDDNFASIVAGIERGRIIFSNIKKAMSYISAIHVPIAGLAILPVLLDWPLILLPTHIVFMELIIDPVSSLMFESQGSQHGIMRDLPRPLKSRLFTIRDMIGSLFQGLLILVVTGITFGIVLHLDDVNPLRARTMAFSILIMSNLGLIFANMSGGSFRELQRLFQRPANRLIALSIVSFLFVGIQVSIFAKIFNLSPLKAFDILISVGVSFMIFITMSLWNGLVRKIAT